MNKILIALAMVGLTYSSAEAQVSESNRGQVCRMQGSKHASCYRTKYAENFKVCMGDNGYYICGETPGRLNSTDPNAQPVVRVEKVTYYLFDNNAMADNKPQPAQDMLIAPQSQSYPANDVVFGINNANSYEGYYPEQKGKIKVCYFGDNVAEDNRMPYQGCPSPQFDGPDKNNYRNMNESTPMDMPPLNGWGSNR